ncbi:MAG TPA: oligosaccharide flippase family protein, partial [Nitrospirota bacterium]|nr:oligosaccharide flippase family protein [Nitrospirota bacterium]
MTGTVKVFKNILSLLSERAVVPAVNLLLVVFIARYMGAQGLGRYAVIVGFVSFFDIFLDLGINTLIIREVARDRSSVDALVARAVTLKLAVTPVIFVSIAVFLRFFEYPPDVVRAFYIFSAASVLIAFSETFNSLYKAFERMNLVALMVFLRQVFIVAAVVAAMEMGYGITGIAVSYLAIAACYLLLNYLLFTLRVGKIKIGLDRHFHVRLFERSLPFITVGFFFVLFFRLDVVMISAVADDAQAGLFSAALKVVSSLMLLSAAFLEAVFPVISKYEAGSPEKMRAAVKKAFHLLSLVSFPMAAGLVVTA